MIYFIHITTYIYVIAHANKVHEQGFNLKHSFLSEFNSASEQAGKLELGKNKTVICFYSNNQVCIMIDIILSNIFLHYYTIFKT